MKVLKFYFIMTLVLASNILHAQEQPFMLTLDQAREYALQHNKTLLNARDQVIYSTEKIKETRAQGLPQVNGSMDFMTYFNYKMNFSFGGSGGTPIDPTDPDFDAGDLKILNSLSSMFGSSEPIIMTNQLSGKVQVSQLIFSGQYWAGIELTKIARELANQGLVSSELDIKESVTNLYYLILVTEQNLRIIKENIDNLNSTLEHTNNLFKNGVMEETDVDQIRIAVSQIQNIQKSVERAIQLSYNMLRFQLGVVPEAQVTLTDSIDKFLVGIDPGVSLNSSYDITNNVLYSLTESQVKLGEKQLDLQNWAYAPTISGFYSYTKKIITTGFDLTPNHLAGFSASIPIFSSGMRKAKVSQAKIDLDIAIRNQEMVKEQLETQKNQLLFNYQNALENYNTQKDNVAIALRVYTSTQNKYKQGLVSSLVLTQANTNYLNAEINYLSSVSTLLQAQTSLDKLYNKI